MRLSRPSRGVLAFLGQQARYRRAETAAGQLLYLLRTGQLVVPDEPGVRGWSCLVVCGPDGASARRRRQVVSDVEIETALWLGPPDPVRDMDLTDFATVWQTRVRDRCPGGATPRVAVVLAELMLRQRGHVVAVDRGAVAHILDRTGLHLSGLRRVLARLVGDGLLTPISHDPVANTGRFVLLLPIGATEAVGYPLTAVASR